jgi:two-component system, response regulator PdtaR
MVCKFCWKAVKKLNSVSVVVVDDEPIVRMDLKEILTGKSYHVVGEAGDGFEAIELCKNTHPDLILLDIKMPLLDGMSAARIIIEENLARAVMLITSYSDDTLVQKAKELGVSGYIVKPFNANSVIPSIVIAMESASRLKRLQTEKDSMSDEIEKRKLIEKAKGLVMQRRSITEKEAYDYIREVSKARNLSMKRVSEIILIQYGE